MDKPNCIKPFLKLSIKLSGVTTKTFIFGYLANIQLIAVTAVNVLPLPVA